MAEEAVSALLMRLDTAATAKSQLLILDKLSEAYYPISPQKADSIACAGLSLDLRHAYPESEAMMHYQLGKGLLTTPGRGTTFYFTLPVHEPPVS